MPVPSEKKAMVCTLRPWPNTNSPKVAVRTSLSSETGQPIFLASTSATGTSRHCVGRLGKNRVTPRRTSTNPGQPMPTACGRASGRGCQLFDQRGDAFEHCGRPGI